MPTFSISGGTTEPGIWERGAVRHRALPSRTRGCPPTAQQGGAPTYVWRRPAAHGRPHKVMHVHSILIDKPFFSYTITTMKDVLTEARRTAKRSGEEAPDAAYKLNVFGNTYNLK